MRELKIFENSEIETWSFYDNSLFELVKSGVKTATCYLSSGEENIEKFSILRGANGELIKLETTKAYELSFNEVDENLAKLEGEGDLSLNYWKVEHKKFFTNELKQMGLTFEDNIKLIFEIFKVIK